MENNIIKKEEIKEFKLARFIAIICMIAVHTEYAIYNYNNETFAYIFDYLGSPFAAPIFMFILGANIILSSHNSPKELFQRGIKLFLTSILFNIICHALPFFIIDYKLGVSCAVENPLHWVFAVDILTFSGLAFIFFGVVRKLKLKNIHLIIFAIASSILNYYLTKYLSFDFTTNTFLASLTSLFYSSSITGYFSFLSWIIFPIAGYIFIQEYQKITNKNKFYIILGSISILIYLLMVLGSFTIFESSPLVIFYEEYSYYNMNLYSAIGNIFFCLGWLSIMYFLSKIIPSSLNPHINRLNKNLTTIYLIQWFIINYFLVLPFNGTLKANEYLFILIFLLITLISDVLSTIYKKIIMERKKYDIIN